MFSVGALVAAAVACPVAGREVRRLLPVGVAIAAAYLPWEVFIRANALGAASTYTFSSLGKPSYLIGHFSRVEVASRALLADLVHVWTLPSAAGLLALICAVLCRRYGLAVLVAAWVGLGFAGLVASYLATTLDVAWQLRTSADRVVGTLAVGTAALSPLLAWEAWRAIRPSLILFLRERTIARGRPDHRGATPYSADRPLG
jgi:hypothetical protein